MRKMGKFLAVGSDFSPSPGLPIKVQGEQSTTSGGNNFVTFLVRRQTPPGK